MADTLRITFELEQPDNPPLYDDLAQFPKGARRVNRLRTLAYAGLLAQLGPHLAPAARATPPARSEDSALSGASLELFGPSADS